MVAGRIRLNPPLQFPKAMMPDYYFYDDDPRDDMLRAFIRAVGTIFAFMLIIVLIALLTSCKTRTVVVETVRTDTTYITRQQRDSIWLHDSIHVTERQQGDTFFVEVEKWKTKYIERMRTDTLIEHRTDSIAYPVEVEKEVPRELTWWQNMRMRMGDAMALLIGISIVIGILKLRRIFMP